MTQMQKQRCKICHMFKPIRRLVLGTCVACRKKELDSQETKPKSVVFCNKTNSGSTPDTLISPIAQLEKGDVLNFKLLKGEITKAIDKFKEQDFCLSDRICENKSFYDASNIFCDDWLAKDDVKEFIQRITDEVIVGNPHSRQMLVKLKRLVGERLL